MSSSVVLGLTVFAWCFVATDLDELSMRGYASFGPEPTRQTARTLEPLWVDLADASGKKAYCAIVQMSANPVGVPEFLYRKMRPTTTVSTTEIEQAIRDLDAHAFTKREEANGVLKRVGKHAEQKLRDNLKQRAYSLESSRRAQKLLALIDREGIRETRAIEALERIGNKCAVAVMQDLAREWAGSSLEKEIGLSLKRMTKENCPHKSK